MSLLSKTGETHVHIPKEINRSQSLWRQSTKNPQSVSVVDKELGCESLACLSRRGDDSEGFEWPDSMIVSNKKRHPEELRFRQL